MKIKDMSIEEIEEMISNCPCNIKDGYSMCKNCILASNIIMERYKMRRFATANEHWSNVEFPPGRVI